MRDERPPQGISKYHFIHNRFSVVLDLWHILFLFFWNFGAKNILAADFSIENLKARTAWTNVLQLLKEDHGCQLPAHISIPSKTISHKHRRKNMIKID